MSSNAVSRLHHALTSRGIKVSSGGAGGGLFRFPCPAHGGKRDSVTASMGDDGRALLCCHSKGCSAEQIAAAVGLTLADLHPAPSRTSKKSERRRVIVDGRELTLHPDKDAAIKAAAFGVSKAAGVVFDANAPPSFTFDYFHESGEPAFSVCRWHVETPEGRRKELRQIRRVDAGGWVVAGPAPNAARPLYRLPELLTADPCRPVYICEGEKAVDALRGAGFVAVTSAGGSSKPGATDWTPLAGRGVIVLPDNDGAGERFAAAVVGILRKLRPAAGVSVGRLRDDCPELPTKGDSVEWLAARKGESYRQLQRRLDELPDITEEIIGAADDSADDAAGEPVDVREEGGKLLQFKDAWQASFRPAPLRPVLIEGLLRRGETANIIASTKTGKSWFALQLLFSVASGREFLGRRVAPGPVVLLDNELHSETLENRLFEIGRAMELGPNAVKHPFEYLSLRGNWRDFDGVAKLCKSRFKRGEVSLFCLDAKYRFFVGGLEENSNEDQAEFHNAVDAFASEMDAAVVLIHHSTKGDQSGRSVVDIGSGGGSQARAVDCHAVIRPHPLDAHGVLEAAVRSFPAVEPATIRFDWPLWSVAAGVTPEVLKAGSNRESRREITAKLRAELATCGDEWLTLSKIAERLGTKSGRAGFREALRELQETGEVEYRNDFKAPRRKDPTEAIRPKVQT
jgi:hypothetical protein